MTVTSLLTFCIGLTCSIMESSINYDAMEAAATVQRNSAELRASRARLYGFREWLSIKTEDAQDEFFASLDDTLNSHFKGIREKIATAKSEGKDVDECYNVALQNLKQAAEDKLQPILLCIGVFVNSSRQNLKDIPERLEEIASLQGNVDSIMPECEMVENRVSCISNRMNQYSTPVSSIESFTRITVEKAHGDYYREHMAMSTCLSPIFDEIVDRINTINSELTECIDNA